jgi:hypothetical protein
MAKSKTLVRTPDAIRIVPLRGEGKALQPLAEGLAEYNMRPYKIVHGRRTGTATITTGVRAVMGGAASCQAFCGYHSDISSKTFYAVMPYPGCTGCTGELSAFDALTSTSSHELCEAITDPEPGLGWYDDTNGEIGDICAW